MNLTELLSIDSYRDTADKIVEVIGTNQDYFNEVLDISLENKYPLAMRAARVIQICVEKHPSLIICHIEKIIDALQLTKIDGVKRSYTKIFYEYVSLAELQKAKNLGILLDLCMKWIMDPQEAIAIRAFSIDVLFKLTKIEPDIAFELKAILELNQNENSPGMKSKIKKVLTLLNPTFKGLD